MSFLTDKIPAGAWKKPVLLQDKSAFRQSRRHPYQAELSQSGQAPAVKVHLRTNSFVLQFLHDFYLLPEQSEQ